jgi:hypothetical protein
MPPALTSVERELLEIEAQAVAAEWTRVHQAERLLAEVDKGLAEMRRIIGEM